MDKGKNFLIALLVVFLIAAPVAIGAIALRQTAQNIGAYDARRAAAVAARVKGGKKIGQAQRDHVLGFLAKHPGAVDTLMLDPDVVIAAGPQAPIPSSFTPGLEEARRRWAVRAV